MYCSNGWFLTAAPVDVTHFPVPAHLGIHRYTPGASSQAKTERPKFPAGENMMLLQK